MLMIAMMNDDKDDENDNNNDNNNNEWSETPSAKETIYIWYQSKNLFSIFSYNAITHVLSIALIHIS